jgi:hypothetical protein
MPYSVGGIPATTTAGTLSGLNLVQLFDDLLFPTVNPTYTIPTITLVSSLTGNKEVGSTIGPVITLTGTENDANYFSRLVIIKSINSGSGVTLSTVSATSSMTVSSVTGIADQFGYTDPNNPNFSYAISYTDTGLVPNPSSGAVSSTVVYSGLGDYTAGLAKKDNKGVTHSVVASIRSINAPQADDINFTTSTQTITGYYPYFYGKTTTQKTATEIAAIIQSGIGFTSVINSAATTYNSVSPSSTSLNMGFGATGEWIWFANYYLFNNKIHWTDTTNPLSNGNIGIVPGPSGDLFATASIITVTSSNGYWAVQYKIYIANKITTLGSAYIA